MLFKYLANDPKPCLGSQKCLFAVNMFIQHAAIELPAHQRPHSHRSLASCPTDVGPNDASP